MNLLKQLFSLGLFKMNHKHQELPISEQGTDHYAETASLKDVDVDVEMGIKPYDIKDDTCIRTLNILYKIVLILFFIASIISLVKLFTGYKVYIHDVEHIIHITYNNTLV